VNENVGNVDSDLYGQCRYNPQAERLTAFACQWIRPGRYSTINGDCVPGMGLY